MIGKAPKATARSEQLNYWTRANSTNWRTKRWNVGKHWVVEKEKHFKTIKREIQLRGESDRLPGSIVAANNMDGRHKMIILFKSDIILLTALRVMNDSR